MFLMNLINTPVEVQKYANYQRVSLKPKAGFRVDSGNRFEVEYYKLLRPAGVGLVTDSYYFGANKIKVPTEKVESVPTISEETKVEETKVEETNSGEGTETGSAENTNDSVVNVTVTEEVKEAVTEETKEGTKTVEVTDKVYTAEEVETLTRDACRTILDARKIDNSELKRVAELREAVLKSNPV